MYRQPAAPGRPMRGIRTRDRIKEQTGLTPERLAKHLPTDHERTRWVAILLNPAGTGIPGKYCYGPTEADAIAKLVKNYGLEPVE